VGGGVEGSVAQFGGRSCAGEFLGQAGGNAISPQMDTDFHGRRERLRDVVLAGARCGCGGGFQGGWPNM